MIALAQGSSVGSSVTGSIFLQSEIKAIHVRPGQLFCLHLADGNIFELVLAQRFRRSAVERPGRRLLTLILVACLELFDQPSDRPFGWMASSAPMLSGAPVVDSLVLFLGPGCGSKRVLA